MKPFKSIKWRLQLWYGLILVAVLAGFGVTAYQLERGRVLRRVDDELHRRFNLLGQALRRPPLRDPQMGQAPDGPLDSLPPDMLPNEDRPPARDFRPGPRENGRGREFHLPPGAEELFGTNDPNGFYFIITRSGGPDGKNEVVAKSDNYQALPIQYGDDGNPYFIRENDDHTLSAKPPGPPGPPKTINFQDQELIGNQLPSGETICVGCSIAPELTELHHIALNLAAFGGLILLVGLAGGGWFVGRALRPITAISGTAAKISAGDLSQRINVAEAESELGQLAAVLNSTFARLETAFAQQKQFASDAAHELRTPVSVMLTQTQTALNRERDAAAYKQTLEACQRAAQRMRKLIESLLELARFDAGQEVLKRVRFDLSKTVAEDIDLVKLLAEERRVKIISELRPLEISGDPGRLAQVVTNLLTNAIQYNRPDGEVRVSLAQEPGLAELKITDTGPGISAADLPRIFERFYRADKSRTGAGNSGLGLAICKAIVEAHGGTLEAASTENVGTTFIVRLPV